MSQVIKATYSKGVFKPSKPVKLKEGAEVEIMLPRLARTRSLTTAQSDAIREFDEVLSNPKAQAKLEAMLIEGLDSGEDEATPELWAKLRKEALAGVRRKPSKRSR